MNEEKDNQADIPQPEEQEGQVVPETEALPPQPTAEELAELRRKAGEYDGMVDRLKRVTADFMNAQKRIERDMNDRVQYAIEGFARELLPVADNLERALQAHSADPHKAEEHKKVLSGVQQIEKQLKDILAKHGVKPIEVKMGDPFNPALHEAISMAESKDHEPNVVLHLTQKGYTIHNRLLRPASVVVSRRPQGQQ